MFCACCSASPPCTMQPMEEPEGCRHHPGGGSFQKPGNASARHHRQDFDVSRTIPFCRRRQDGLQNDRKKCHLANATEVCISDVYNFDVKGNPNDHPPHKFEIEDARRYWRGRGLTGAVLEKKVAWVFDTNLLQNDEANSFLASSRCSRASIRDTAGYGPKASVFCLPPKR